MALRVYSGMPQYVGLIARVPAVGDGLMSVDWDFFSHER